MDDRDQFHKFGRIFKKINVIFEFSTLLHKNMAFIGEFTLVVRIISSLSLRQAE